MLNVIATDLNRLMRCNGSRIMAAVLPPDINREARDEGNAADWLAIQGFNGVDIGTLENTKAPNGYFIDGDMIVHVSSYLKALDCGEVQADTSHAGATWQIAGRCDHRKWSEKTATLIIDELKYGHRYVEPYDNWTLLSHAIGTVIQLQIRPQWIVLRIHQPRAFHPDGPLREERITYDELLKYYDQINATLSDPSDIVNSGDHCHYCHAEPTCPARRMAMYNSIDASTMAYNDDISPENLAYMLDQIGTAKARLDAHHDALSELARHTINSGTPVDGYFVEQKYGHRAFNKGLTGEFLTLTTGVDCTKSGTVSPAEASRRGVPDNVLDKITYRPVIGSKLTRANADRQARKVLGK